MSYSSDRHKSFAIRPMLYQLSTQGLKQIFGYGNRQICAQPPERKNKNKPDDPVQTSAPKPCTPR